MNNLVKSNDVLVSIEHQCTASTNGEKIHHVTLYSASQTEYVVILVIVCVVFSSKFWLRGDRKIQSHEYVRESRRKSSFSICLQEIAIVFDGYWLQILRHRPVRII